MVSRIGGMPTGREMDVLIAEEVMGWTLRAFNGQGTDSLWDDESLFNAVTEAGFTHVDRESKLRQILPFTASAVVDRLDELYSA